MTARPSAQKPVAGRYVVLEHDHPSLHWDFMLEVDGALRTWRLPQPPGFAAAMIAVSLPDHRLAYLDYEGPVSGERGSVSRWDRGTFVATDLSRDAVKSRIVGEHWSGIVEMRRTDEVNWLADWRGG